MPAISWQALRSISRSLSPKACLVVARRSLPPSSRAFHAVSNLKSSHEDNSDKSGFPHIKPEESQESAQAAGRQGQNWVGGEGTERTENVTEKPQEAGGQEDDAGTGDKKPAEQSAKTKDPSNYGSAKNRALRNTLKPKEFPKVTVPRSFLENNVHLYNEHNFNQPGRLHFQLNDSSNAIIGQSEVCEGSKFSPSILELPTDVVTPKQDVGHEASTYVVEEAVFREVESRIRAGLHPLPPQTAGTLQLPKRDLLIHCPKDGGLHFLDNIVGVAATAAKADLILLDAQDFAEIGSSYLTEPDNTHLRSLPNLGYEAHLVMSQADNEEDGLEEDSEANENDEDEVDRNRGNRPAVHSAGRVVPMHLTAVLGGFKDFFKPADAPSPRGSGSSHMGPFRVMKPSGPTADELDDAHVSEFFDALLNAAHQKGRSMAPQNNQQTSLDSAAIGHSKTSDEREGQSTDSIEHESSSIILMVRDYWEINATYTGHKILSKLHETLDKRRQEGQRVMIVGTTSSEDIISLSKSGFKTFESEPNARCSKMIVTPLRTAANQEILDYQQKIRTFKINARHLCNNLQKLAPEFQQMERDELALDSAEIYASGLDEGIWTFERIQRLASITLGLASLEGQQIKAEHVKRALQIVDQSDTAKFEWVTQEKEEELKENEGQNRSRSESQKGKEQNMKKLRRSCNTHEKKLLAGVINAESIKTTFMDVQAPPETIEALQTLTSLSLIRPEAFKYGVLATDKIPGLLLYGPPGTGKTLLAKAVAKESGATVLEVSGSDVYDMYVGEGEKNVRAIFSLAKKLSPCIVFIDEADAIFGSRSASVNRTSHRELINQFLREWDGMNDLSAFIMVATNRPFDLDDAVLRRLPRRLLVDLPTEKDREVILNIHLKGELIDRSVSTATLAAQTPYYSGSDLKNLAVAAALACVKEENESAAAARLKSASSSRGDANGDEENLTSLPTYSYPEKRTLSQRHFDKAMGEIGSSVSEDMSSLAAIKKFDERFGERRGRRRGRGYGFGTLSEEERERVAEEGGRVRRS